ncbi:hypothetical protein BC936DRAFT_149262 [Jimgerdemannia flammicorona]|uniref:Uncharacterized protein n=1 Tax=Jimgerdemannia flammicorona TaxID=994334 RepID=A0A433D166_9FUNG|nr:hypothetical protein BC936DRAFT_149262 [Jimgerdemannia flammicorona]
MPPFLPQNVSRAKKAHQAALSGQRGKGKFQRASENAHLGGLKEGDVARHEGMRVGFCEAWRKVLVGGSGTD